MAQADVVTDWNVKAGEIVVAAKLGTPPANRVLAIVQTAVYEATNAITKRYPASGPQLEAAPGASVDAAIAAANRATLAQLVPSQQAAIDAAYQAALATITDGPAKTAGIAVGEKAAASRSWRGAPMTAPPRGRHTGRTPLRGLRADGHTGGPAVATAQAVADDEPRPVPSRSAAHAHE